MKYKINNINYQSRELQEVLQLITVEEFEMTFYQEGNNLQVIQTNLNN